MGFRIGSGYDGSSAILTSTANVEIIPAGKEYYKFEFINYSATTIIINGGSPIYRNAEQGWVTDITDQPIRSFKVVSANVQYTWSGAF